MLDIRSLWFLQALWVSEKMTITTTNGKQVDGLNQAPFEPVAVIGMAALMPDATSMEEFWQNIIDAHVSIKEVSKDRWDPDIYWENGAPGNVTEGKTYSKIGGFVEDYEFDWRRWRQPPGTLPQIDPCQLWAVTVSADAIDDAGYGEGGKTLDRARTGVIFANALGGENRSESNIRIFSSEMRKIALDNGATPEQADAMVEKMCEGKPRIDEDTMPGELANVVSGRVANLLDLQGPNYSTDAACASSMAALLDACRLLQTRQVDTMLAGATDRCMEAPTYAKFSAIGALSPSHSTPFDARANGFVMGEGAGVLLLKRLSDAIDAGDDIKAVIRGVGGSSDGRGKGITAPSQRGQVQAVSRAYSQAGYEPSTVELVEAHGTSTKVGDATELSTLSLLWTGLDGGDHIAVGSVKSQIGHLKAAAGIAGIMKACNSVYHKTIPPSAGFQTPNPTVEWDEIPFFVPTEARDWPEPESHPRRAGISAFGFGGTNFHVAVEGYDLEYHSKLVEHWNGRWEAYAGIESSSSEAKPTMTHEELKAVEGGLLLLSGDSIDSLKSKLSALTFSGPNFDDDPRGMRLSFTLDSHWSFDVKDTVRMALSATSWAEFNKRKDLAIKAMDDKEKWGFLMSQGIMISDTPALPKQAKVAHMYPGQGSQYVGMTNDLHSRFSGVGDVWDKADVTMVDVLDGETLSSFVLRDGLTAEEMKEAEHKLKQTEYTQPAMLTADLAIEAALNAHGHKPDMVAGHSLGEYAALMSAGILDMDGALRAAAARGTEMGSVEIDDKGLMASVTAPYDRIAEIIEEVDGYVIAANKNSPKMTVIAGETEPVKQAMSRFEAEGFQCVALATSHAFHSRIVAPANEPLRRFLEGLDIRWPKIPITSNVDGGWYPMDDGGDSKAAILSKLAPQMASSVEWTSQINSMYDAGARLFLEVGPKRALTVFASQILEGKQALPIMTNHPKAGGIATFLTALGTLALAGRVPEWPGPNSAHLTPAFRAGPIEAAGGAKQPATPLKERSRPLPSKGGQTVTQTVIQSSETYVDPDAAKKALVGELIAAQTGYPAKFCQGNVDMRAVLGMSDEQIQVVVSSVHARCSTDPDWDITIAKTPGDITRWITSAPAIGSKSKSMKHDDRDDDPFVITGISMGLPGGERVFDEGNFEKLVRGETCITEVTDEYKQRLLDKNIVRLIKGRDGSVGMDAATEFGDIPQLAGVKSAFDPTEEFGIDAKVAAAWDIATQLSCAAGLIALKDAGIPLTPVEQVGKGGLRLIRSWQMPSAYRDRTGIVFASCFAGHQMAARHAKVNGDDGEGRFDRRYLFQILNMGHSQFAQHVGIRGPNTTINLACASATAAFGVAEDWLANDRCDRVVIISADDVTGDDLWEWIGSGFAASGAAATNNSVEETALPFDKRRNGLILGMGAAAFVVERKSESDARGVQPMAELLGTRIANSAFHGTRLDVEHVASTVDDFVSEMEERWGLDRHQMAPDTVFFSHETYTPARGGSAQAEVKALRDTFGASTDSIVIANTKGFTGHPMGVGIEDAAMFYGLMTGRIPPIANHKETDPELGNLKLSKGGDYSNLKYGMRFAAGFGSQIGLSLVRKCEFTGDRINKQKLLTWNQSQAGTTNLELRVLQNKLVAYVDADNNLHGGILGDEYAVPREIDSIEAPVIESSPAPKPEPVAPAPAEPTPVASAPSGDTTSIVIEVVVKHTGYPADFVELDQDLEGQLGIDTVKQAEIMADIREKFGLPIDEDFVLSDYPTLNHMIAYIHKMQGGSPAPVAPKTVTEVSTPEPVPKAEPAPAPAPVASEQSSAVDIQPKLIGVVVKHTGYPEDFIEMDQDLEGELGIDTVKQAEIMGDVREIFSLPIDEDFVLSEHPTLNHFVAYIQKMTGGNAPVPTPAPVETTSPAAPTPVEVPATPTVSADSGDIQPKLIGVVVKHTGYPEDFIEMDQDLEGELGIDTVKQAEIMGDVREIFSLPVDEDFVLSDHPTLNHFVAYIQRMTGGSTPASTPAPAPVEVKSPVAPTPVEAPTTPTVSADSGEIQVKLIGVVVKHTGYPDDFIEMDQDLEGELGIDTVKQAEIMGDVREIFSLPVDEDFVLSDHPTLNHFVAYIQKMKGGGAPAPAPVAKPVPQPVAPQPVPSTPVSNSKPIAESTTRRWQVEVEPCPAVAEGLPIGGTIVLTQDSWGVADALADRLVEKGLSVAKIGFEFGAKSVTEQEELSGHTFRADPGSEEQIAEVCSRISGVAGIIHLAPLSLTGSSWEADGPSNQVNLAAQSWFGLLKGLDSQLGVISSGIVGSVTALDGRHGNRGERFNSLACAASGVTKSYAFERENLRCRALDLHPELIIDAASAAEVIDNDLFTAGGEIEIGIDRDGRRWTMVCFAEDVVEDVEPLQSDDLWLVSGGGSGVTAASIIGVSSASNGAGATFLLLGRSKLVEETSGWLDWSDDQLNQRKMELRESLIAESESGKVTMVEWNNAWTKLTRSMDIYRTISDIEASGNNAEYHSADVTDSEAIKSAVNGRDVTGIVHGAGLEESKLVADKAWNTFDLIVRVKVDGWKALASAAGDSLRFACAFTSVAGRFGNRGQTDYAAANSILDAEMARMTANSECRAVAIGWTGWRDVGMATRGSIEAVFESSGIETLSVEDGVEIFVKEALAGGKRRVLGCGSLGNMDLFDSFREAPLKLPAEMAASIADPRRFPLIDKLLSIEEGESLVSQCTLSMQEHPFLVDHAIDGVPYHPGVMALEMFAENSLLLMPSHCLAGFEEVTFGLPVKIMKGDMTVRVEATLSRTDGDLSWVKCRLVSDLTNSKGEVFGEPRLHHEAMVRLVATSDDLRPFLQNEVDSLPAIGTPPHGDLLHHSSFIYLRYFHGPRFQSHGGVLRGVENGVDGIALMRHQLPATDQFALESDGEEVLLDALPMLIEAGFQNAGLAAMESDGFSSLPIGIEWTTMLRVPDANESLRMRSVKVATEDAGITVHDVVIVGEDDAPVLSLKGLRLKAMGQVPEDQRFSLER
ncbi:MAG: acyltransferase domain-containing protein [Candidatus Poseidoniales archaeon]|nr:MAG: acyltransferase domain-containing protein [Candidatus Poseidoniales archaeon]